jgi:hypothetical protein
LRRDPRAALSVAPADDPLSPVVVRGRVVEWLDGDEARRIVCVVEPDSQALGVS